MHGKEDHDAELFAIAGGSFVYDYSAIVSLVDTLTSSKWYFRPHEVQINMDLRAVQCLVIRTTAGLPQSTGIACMAQGLGHWRVSLEDVDLTFNVVRKR